MEQITNKSSALALRKAKFTKLVRGLVKMIKHKVFRVKGPESHVPKDPEVLRVYFDHLARNNAANLKRNQELLADFFAKHAIDAKCREALKLQYEDDADIAQGWSRLTESRIIGEYNRLVVDQILGPNALDYLEAVDLFSGIGLDLHALRSGHAIIEDEKLEVLKGEDFRRKYKKVTSSLKRWFTFRRTKSRDKQLKTFYRKYGVAKRFRAPLLRVFHLWRFWGPRKIVSESEFLGVYYALLIQDIVGVFDVENPAIVELFEDHGLDLENIFAGEVVLTREQIATMRSKEFLKKLNKITERNENYE